jgi:putative addiction module component (TIGR02574 family)
MMEALGLDQLGLDERLRLVEELCESIATTPGAVTLSEAQKGDLLRRLDVYRDNPKAGMPWEEVKARLLGSAR